MALYRGVVTIEHPSLGGTGTNTWHFRTVAVDQLENADADGLSDILEQFYTDLDPIYPGGTVLHFDGELSGVGSNEGTYVQATDWTVTIGGGIPPLPPATSLVVSWRGQSGDRSRRGRTFLGPLGTGNLEGDGTPTSSCLTTARDAAAALVSSSDSFANGAFGVWSRQESVLRDFVGSTVANQFAVLRSRRD